MVSMVLTYTLTLTGISTGDIHKDPNFLSIPGMAQVRDDTVVAVKSHYPYYHCLKGTLQQEKMGGREVDR